MSRLPRSSAGFALRVAALFLLLIGLVSQLPSEASAAQGTSGSTGAAAETDMYRLYNPNSGEHFYTADLNEAKNVLKAGWQWEGIGWVAPKRSSTPVYRLYSGTDHHYTTSAKERDWDVEQGWKYEGIGWYSDEAKSTPLYREFNPNVDPSAERNNSGSHNYTTSREENDGLVSKGWNAEGIGWYGSATKALPIEPFTFRSNAWGDGYRQYQVDANGKVSRVRTKDDDARELGETVAKVAVACAGTADPDGVIHNTGANAPWSKVNDSRLSTWFAVADATLGTFGGNTAYSSCAQAVAGVLGATVDPDIAGNLSGKDAIEVPSSGPGTVWSYIREHPEMYQKVSGADDIRPGDIMCSEGHIALYVGNEAARAKFPNTSATVFQASFPDQFPMLNDWPKDYIYQRFNGEVYHVAARNEGPVYPFIDYESLI